MTPAWAIAAGPGSRASDELGLDLAVGRSAMSAPMRRAVAGFDAPGSIDLLTVYADDEDDDEAVGDEHAAADGGTGRDEDRS